MMNLGVLCRNLVYGIGVASHAGDDPKDNVCC
jgi:hypothetical protein